MRQSKPIRSLLSLLALISLVGMPYSVLMPIFADRILHGGPNTLGFLMGASGIGALLAALLLAPAKPWSDSGSGSPALPRYSARRSSASRSPGRYG